MTDRPPFELFEILIAAAESRNFLEAARRLGLSQGAVSMKLKRLQSRLPLPVFTLKGKKNILTHYGREVYEFARRQQDELRIRYDDVNRKYSAPENLSISVGCRRELLERLAPKLLFGGRVVHRALSSRDALAELLARRIDIAISNERPDLTEVMARKVLMSGCNLIVHRKLLGKGQGIKTPEFYLRNPCILYSEDGHLLSPWIAHLGLSLEQLRPRFVTEDWRTLASLVDGGHGYAVVPDYVLPQDKNVAVFPLPKEVLPAFTFYAVFHKELLQIPAIKKMISSLQ